MESETHGHRRMGKAMAPRAPDRISALPDPILDHILSLMPVKAATRATVLSSRWRGLWRNIWASATTLDFTAEFAGHQTPEEFVRNVNRFLGLHGARKVQKFLLSFHPAGRYLSDVEKWVEFAAAKDVEELLLDLSPEQQADYYDGDPESWDNPFKIAHHLFAEGSLTVLGLSHCSFLPGSDLGRLRSLTSVSLRHVNITDDMLRGILSGCRLLESLFLRDCVHFHSVKVTSPDIMLKHLALVDCWELAELEITTPNLQSFHFSGEIRFDPYSFGGTSSLKDAFICSIDRMSGEPENDYIQLLSDVAQVEVLTVCTATLMCVTIWSEYMPDRVPIPLPNLRELQLLMDHMNMEYVQYIYGFFRLCPSTSLERLFIRFPKEPEISGPVETTQEKLPDVHFNQLKVIKMLNFKGSRSEMKLVACLLEKAAVLETLVLVAPPKSSAKGGVVTAEDSSLSELRFMEGMDMRILHGQLLALPRASSAVQISVCEYLEDYANISPTHTELYGNM